MIRLCFVRGRWPLLIVAPNAEVLLQWEQEWKKWVANVKTFVIMKKTAPWVKHLGNSNIVCLTTYYFLGNSHVSHSKSCISVLVAVY